MLLTVEAAAYPPLCDNSDSAGGVTQQTESNPRGPHASRDEAAG